MGEIRESIDPNEDLPSCLFKIADVPEKTDILLNDISEILVIKDSTQEFGYLSYDEYDKFQAAGLKGARAGRRLRGKLK